MEEEDEDQLPERNNLKLSRQQHESGEQSQRQPVSRWVDMDDEDDEAGTLVSVRGATCKILASYSTASFLQRTALPPSVRFGPLQSIAEQEDSEDGTGEDLAECASEFFQLSSPSPTNSSCSSPSAATCSSGRSTGVSSDGEDTAPWPVLLGASSGELQAATQGVKVLLQLGSPSVM